MKNVVLHSVATALAIKVFPVPGGPNNKTPFHGSRSPIRYFNVNESDLIQNTRKELGIFDRKYNSLFDQTLCILIANDILETDVWVNDYDISKKRVLD